MRFGKVKRTFVEGLVAGFAGIARRAYQRWKVFDDLFQFFNCRDAWEKISKK